MVPVRTKRHEGFSVLEPHGQLDVITTQTPLSEETAALTECITEEIERGQTKFILDLSQIDYVDSHGLYIVLNARLAVRKRQGTLLLAALPANTLRAFKMTGLDSVLPMYATVDDAIAALDETTEFSL